MPVRECSEDGKPGYKWGEAGKCYTFTPGNDASQKEAKRKAINQGIAIGDIAVKFVDGDPMGVEGEEVYRLWAPGQD